MSRAIFDFSRYELVENRDKCETFKNILLFTGMTYK